MSGSGPETSWDDVALVEACRRGHQPAWDTLVDRYSRLVYSIAMRYRLPDQEAAEVFQGVWLDLYRDLPKLQHAAALRSWLVTAASRRCQTHKKRLQAMWTPDGGELAGGVADPSPNPYEVQQDSERAYLLRTAIERIPERCQALVRMLFFEDPPVPYGEAARRLGLAEGSIGFIRGRCLARLRKQLQELGAE